VSLAIKFNHITIYLLELASLGIALIYLVPTDTVEPETILLSVNEECLLIN